MDEIKYEGNPHEDNPPQETVIIKKPNQDLGLAIVSEAAEQYQNDLKKAVINKVVGYQKVMGNLKKKIKMIKEVIEFNQKKINALKEGDFDFDMETGEIHFHNDDLNIEWENIL